MSTLSELLGTPARVVQISPDATVREAAKAMAESNVSCVDVGCLHGVLSMRDLVLDEVQEMRDYIALTEG